MVDAATTLKIIGAAEGSWYRNVDLRYRPSFANASSGMSFGTFQFDMSTNQQGRDGLSGILKSAVTAKTIDQAASVRILADASKKNAKAFMNQADLATVTKLLALPASNLAINTLDNQRALTEGAQVDMMIAAAAGVWRAKGVTGAAIHSGAGQLPASVWIPAGESKPFPSQQGDFSVLAWRPKGCNRGGATGRIPTDGGAVD